MLSEYKKRKVSYINRILLKKSCSIAFVGSYVRDLLKIKYRLRSKFRCIIFFILSIIICMYISGMYRERMSRFYCYLKLLSKVSNFIFSCC